MWRPRAPATTGGRATGTVAPVMWRPGLPGPITTTRSPPDLRATFSEADTEFAVVVGTSTGGTVLAILALVAFFLLSK